MEENYVSEIGRRNTMRKDQRGMTLIELVVVMMIAVILMGIAGSLLMVSTQYYRDIVVSDRDKQSLDAIADYVRSELLYATAIEIQEEQKTEEGWSYFYISEQAKGRLYHNQTSEHLYSDSFYNNRFLSMKTRAYEGYRMDVGFLYCDEQAEQIYQTSQSLVLPNIKIQDDKGADVLHNIEITNESKGYYIYYKKGNVQEETTYAGTIKDQIACKDKDEASRDMGNYDLISNKRDIKQGDFVYIINASGEQEWYRYVLASSSSDTKPGGNDGSWKRLTSDLYDASSNYLRGDIVRFSYGNEDMFFVYTYDKSLYLAGGDKNLSTNNTGYFNPVYLNKYKAPFCDITSTSGEGLNYTYVLGSPYAKLYEANIVPEQDHVTQSSSATLIPSSKQGITSATYVVEDKNKELWINVSTQAQRSDLVEQDTDTLHWQKLQVYWDQKSAYQKGDIVMVGNDTYMAQKDITSKSNNVDPSTQKYNGDAWVWVRYNPKSRAWVKRYS